MSNDYQHPNYKIGMKTVYVIPVIKFIPGHRCKRKLFLFVHQDDEIPPFDSLKTLPSSFNTKHDLDPQPSSSTLDNSSGDNPTPANSYISLHALLGIYLQKHYV